ncbi:MAG: prepilin-type N-terminal cleavage/methylation domain-containing protein [Candidatus Hydrogenedentes bacterium]|nr:prepilin-type N-terminal cleavage/methylation domain-containing protein [Candidatus Hydrogenedentota bacterium]
MAFKNDSGFSLIELCIASGIMAVAFLFIIGGVVDASSSNSVITTNTLANTQLTSTLEELRGTPFSTMVTTTPTAVDGLGASAVISLAAVDSSGGLVTFPITNAATVAALPNPVEVRATITWRDVNGRLLSQSLSTQFRQ